MIGAGFIYEIWQRGKQAESVLTIKGRTPALSSPFTPPKLAANQPAPSPVVASSQAPAAAPRELIVHVAGAVKKPGVYHLPADSRVNDAILKAGGPREGADLDSINLAARIEDGQQILVAPQAAATSISLAAKEPPDRTPPRKGQPSEAPESAKLEKFSQPGKDSVNINTATAEQLQRLPGVGPAMADRILAHRKESGRFTDPEQLMDVSGIGEKKFAKMRPFVKVR